MKLWMARFRRRRAVSTMIGGIIILTLILSALGTMVFVGQQFDIYQKTVNQMSQEDIERFSENLVAVFPGLSGPNSTSGCGGQCTQYNMTISNLAGIDVQISRIYINSTGSGCTPSPCILEMSNTPSSYRFRMADRYVNPAETNHAVLLWLPSTVTLPKPDPPSPVNRISIVTTRGRVFSFGWPFPPTGTALGGQSGAAVSTGVMRIAYQGDYNSAVEDSTYPNAPYCHHETLESYPATTGHKETLTGITGVTGGSLTFVNSWITNQILQSAYSGGTTLYIYARVVNTVATQITVKGGALVISTATSGSNSKQLFIGGVLFGIYYNGVFTASPSSPWIQPNEMFYVIFKIVSFTQNIYQETPGLLFTGTASLTNQERNEQYFSGEVVLDGVYIRTSCTTP